MVWYPPNAMIESPHHAVVLSPHYVKCGNGVPPPAQYRSIAVAKQYQGFLDGSWVDIEDRHTRENAARLRYIHGDHVGAVHLFGDYGWMTGVPTDMLYDYGWYIGSYMQYPTSISDPNPLVDNVNLVEERIAGFDVATAENELGQTVPWSFTWSLRYFDWPWPNKACGLSAWAECAVGPGDYFGGQYGAPLLDLSFATGDTGPDDRWRGLSSFAVNYSGWLLDGAGTSVLAYKSEFRIDSIRKYAIIGGLVRSNVTSGYWLQGMQVVETGITTPNVPVPIPYPTGHDTLPDPADPNESIYLGYVNTVEWLD
jgi:hypothetical protein